MLVPMYTSPTSTCYYYSCVCVCVYLYIMPYTYMRVSLFQSYTTTLFIKLLKILFDGETNLC